MIKICECGCGKQFEVNKRWKYRKFAQRFISGHNLFLKEVKEKSKLSQGTPECRERNRIRGKLRYLNGGFIPSRKGLPSPNKGKHLTSAQKDVLRKANLGKHHTQKTKDLCREKAIKGNYGSWLIGRKLSKQTRKKISDCRIGILPKNVQRPGRFGNVQRGWFNIGKKKMFFRSKWEANYALYLNFLIAQKQIKKWEYEKDVFIFHAIQFGTRSYRPDFKIFNNSGTIEYHEVKGYMDKKSITKIKRMAKYYPQIKLIIIDSVYYRDIKNKLGRLLKFY
jgi:hypothetical protein